MRNLKIYGPKINRSRNAARGLARRTRTRLVCDISASLGERRCRNLCSEKPLPESIWLSEGRFFWVFPRAQGALFLISTLNSFQGVLKVNSLEWSWCNLCRDSWQAPTSSQQGPFIAAYLTMFGGHFMPTVSHGAGKVHSQVSGRSHWEVTQCAIIGPGLASSKSLWTRPVLLASWSKKIFPLVASSHILSYIITIIDLIWNCISAFYHRLKQAFSNIRNISETSGTENNIASKY